GVFSKSAKVHSNDPQHPKTRITISCTVKQYISVLPGNTIKLQGFEGDKIKKKVAITSPEGHPFEITDISSNIEDKIKYKLKKGGKGYTVEVKNRSTKRDRFRGNIVMKTSSEKKPYVVLPVRGELKGKVAISSKILSFGTIDTGKDNFDTISLKKTVVLRDVRGDGLAIKKIKTTSDWIVTETKKRGAKQSIIVITLDNDILLKGKFNEKIEIYTNYKGKPMVVEIRGEVI
ncbi:MAG: hypothetical protein JRJ00_10960, partial [Deltaproteobacteria bacterium]|nr:hypothetical protein [Deltaproteobacteria bacterium]